MLGPRPGRQLVVALAVMVFLTAASTLAFIVIENLPLREALYLTITTLSTVGYGDVVPHTPTGRWLAIGLIVAGIGAVLYTVVVIDSDPERVGECESDGHLCISGSALDDGVLERAGIRRARAIVAATQSDPDNVYITLSAREANSAIQIHARAQSQFGTRRLKLAGADQVVSPYEIGGMRIANAIMRPAVVEFLELSAPGQGGEIDLEEVVLPEGSSVSGVLLRDLEARGIRVSVVAIKRGDEPIRIMPGPEISLRGGDHMIVVGDSENLSRLAALAEAG